MQVNAQLLAAIRHLNLSVTNHELAGLLVDVAAKITLDRVNDVAVDVLIEDSIDLVTRFTANLGFDTDMVLTFEDEEGED